MKVQCPGCRGVSVVADRLGGRTARCPCGQLMKLPHHDDHHPDDQFGVMMDMARVSHAVAPAQPDRTAITPARVVMTAAPFGTATLFPAVVTVGSSSGQTALRQRLAPGCFDACLKDAAAGRHQVKLLAEHDPARSLGSTRDGTLVVWADAASLWVSVPEEVARRAKAAGLSALSPGWVTTSDRTARDHAGPVTDTIVGLLLEVSFVPTGNFPDTGDPIAGVRREAARLVRGHGTKARVR